MSWLMHHSESERYATAAEVAIRLGAPEGAIDLYRKAAEEELRALESIDKSKTRTLGITAVSAASLWYKAREFQQAQNTAFQWLSSNALPEFAAHQLKQLLQTIWSEEIRAKADAMFTKGEVLVSVSGGEVVVGGAPLELILQKVREVSGLFYRAIEMLLHLPLRKRGEPSLEIQQQCRPWLFQVPTGSYQFAVRIQKPSQLELFPSRAPEIEEVTQKFIEIVRASAEESGEMLKRAVPDSEYRAMFLKMTRNLAPTGKTFSKLEIRAAGEPNIDPVVLVPESREVMNVSIRGPEIEVIKAGKQTDPIRLIGVLRALHLDNDWLELSSVEGEEKPVKVYDTGEVIDDIVGPMVNRRVIIDVIKQRNKYIFRDIQIEE